MFINTVPRMIALVPRSLLRRSKPNDSREQLVHFTLNCAEFFAVPHFVFRVGVWEGGGAATMKCYRVVQTLIPF